MHAIAQEVDLFEDLEELGLVALSKVELELEVAVEMIDDGSLAAAGDKDDLLDPAGDRLLDAVLNGGLVHQRQHLFRLSLGDG